ncbi:Bifunctional riboflavin kinase/FMN adenylyltransferase [Halomonadaceae bacterium LMG 33818]|uniref:bifunctional riboflavin kinase/FAD synthetase n=1 Tax=Cernens ardua TaxID=3402176 RepID=UPI003EDBB4BA
MKLIRGLHNIRAEHQGGVATIGNFDGVHQGHVALLEQLHNRAREAQVPLTVVLFEPQPREYFAGKQAPPRLTRLRDKLKLLAEHGVDQVLCLPFNRHLRELSAQAFIQKVLVDGLKISDLVVGDDFRFGCDRDGDFHLLLEAGAHAGFRVEHTQTFDAEGGRVSSSRVRTLLASGNFDSAARLLGRPYGYSGRVIADRQLGRTIGIPTANIPLPDAPLVLSGVYAAAVFLENGAYYAGALNVGWRPTVGSKRPVLEVHLIDFKGDLYGKRITVIPCLRLRSEISFDGIEALKRQLEFDVNFSRIYMRGAKESLAAADNSFASHGDRETMRQEDGKGKRHGGAPHRFFNAHDLPLATAPLTPPSQQQLADLMRNE